MRPYWSFLIVRNVIKGVLGICIDVYPVSDAAINPGFSDLSERPLMFFTRTRTPMPNSSSTNMFYLGTLKPIDPDLKLRAVSGSAQVLGSYDRPQAVWVTRRNICANGTLRDGKIWPLEADAGLADQAALPDTEHPDEPQGILEYDIGLGPEAYENVIELSYASRLTLSDGTVEHETVAVIQTVVGDIFAQCANPGQITRKIRRIELLCVHHDAPHAAKAQTHVPQLPAMCLSGGTKIETDKGTVRIEELQIGTGLLTIDGTFLPVLGIAQMEIPDRTGLETIHIPASTFGPDIPAKSLDLPPEQRVLIRSEIVRKMFGQEEVILPAKRLLTLRGPSKTRKVPLESAWHILVPEAGLIFANGLPVEISPPDRHTLPSLPDDTNCGFSLALTGFDPRARQTAGPARMIPAEHA